jgi:hypothetical protein
MCYILGEKSPHCGAQDRSARYAFVGVCYNKMIYDLIYLSISNRDTFLT